jgi:hypothetical protein
VCAASETHYQCMYIQDTLATEIATGRCLYNQGNI